MTSTSLIFFAGGGSQLLKFEIVGLSDVRLVFKDEEVSGPAFLLPGILSMTNIRIYDLRRGADCTVPNIAILEGRYTKSNKP